MATQSHFPTPLMSYSFTSSAVVRNTLCNRIAPVDNRPSRLRTTTGPGAPALSRRRLRGQTGRSGKSLTASAGFGSAGGTSLQVFEMIDVVWVVRAWWIMVTVPILAAPKIPALYELLVSLTGRGKIMKYSPKELSVPQKFFCHFYIVGVTWTTFVLVANWLYAYQLTPIVSDQSYDIWRSVFLLILMEAQVLRRLYESFCVFKYSPSARMHIATYLSGLLFYIATPVSLCCTHSMEVLEFARSLVAEFMDKGMQVRDFDMWGHLNPLMQLNWYVWFGAAVFCWGSIHQFRCHAILGCLRKNNQEVHKYTIPEGDWFKYVSSPHYLAEIVIYGGVLIASGLSDITIWMLFVLVVANLTFAAVQTHKWYLRKFDNYPKNRYAIIPFFY